MGNNQSPNSKHNRYEGTEAQSSKGTKDENIIHNIKDKVTKTQSNIKYKKTLCLYALVPLCLLIWLTRSER